MSDGGGDTGGGGDMGGGGKGSSSGGTDFSAPSSFAPPDSAGGSVSDFTSNPTGDVGGGGTGGTSQFDIVNDPSQGNLTGPGPVGGDAGLPGAGGGTNSPFSFDNSSFLSGGADAFTGQPTSTGGVFDSGTAGYSSYGQPGQPAMQSMIDSTAAAPPGASAAGIAGLPGVGGSPDAASSSTDLSSSNRSTTNASSGGSGASPSSGILDSLGIKSNPLGLVTAGVGLANTLVNGSKVDANVKALQAQAANGNQIAQQLLDASKPITAQGAQFVTSGQNQVDTGAALQQYVATGTLPQGYEDQVQQAAQAAKTRAISNAAANGQPTDPTHNTTLAAQLDAIDKQLPAMREQLATQLASTGNSIVGAGNQTAGTGNALSGNSLVSSGLQASGISSDIYAKLASIDQANNAATGQAIGNFAAALNGGNKGLTLKVA